MTQLYLGFEKGGPLTPVLEPLAHLAVFGQTRRAGKTTSLRTIITRAAEEGQADVVVFRTGTGEIEFPGAHRSTPFFREAVDWRGVEAMLWSFLGEKPKVYRTLVMKAVRGARTLEDVHRNVVAAAKKEHSAWARDMAYQLDQYFQEILPWLRGHELATTADFHSGLNVVDLERWPKTVQQLVIAATLNRLMEYGKRTHPLLVVLPEARTFIPSDSATPVKLAADRFAREGAKLNLFLWIDSQALTGVDQQVLRNFALLLQGVQTSDLEIRRVAKALEVEPRAVRSLKVGDFILHTPDGVRTIHVPLVEPKEETKVDEKERKQYEDHIAKLERNLDDLRDQLAEANRRAEANAKAAAANAVERIETAPRLAAVVGESPTDEQAAHMLEGQRFVLAATGGKAPAQKLHLETRTTEARLTAHVVEKHIDAKLDDSDSRLGALIAEGWFDAQKANSNVRDEMRARGWGSWIGGGGNDAMNELLGRFTEWGFLRRTEGNKKILYSAIPEAKARITVKRERA